MYCSSSSQSATVKTLAPAVGMPASCITCLLKSLLPSSAAQAWSGPIKCNVRKNRSACCCRKSTNPSTSGCSGPTTTSSRFRSRMVRASVSKSDRVMDRFSNSRSVPPLPGATNSFEISGLSDNLWARACSRAPEPRMSAFKRKGSYR